MNSLPVFPNEFALIAAGCARPLDGDRLRAIASAHLDWTSVVRLARRHRVSGLVHAALAQARCAVPPAAIAAFADDARAIAQANLAYARLCCGLQRAFDAASIAVIFVKGVALAQQAYGTLAVKHGRDIDLLVKPAQVAAALRLIEAEGFILRSPAQSLNPAQLGALLRYGSQIELARGADGARLELHWRLADNDQLLRGVDPFATSMSLELGGGAVRTLPPADLFVYLCAHGAGHAWFRLKWLADLNALLAREDADGIAALYRHAVHCGAGLCAGQALLLCHRLFGLDLPAVLRTELDHDRRVVRLAAEAATALAGDDPAGRSTPARTLHNTLAPFRIGRGWRFHLVQCRRVLIGPLDAVRLPLPPSLAFLYPLLRLPLWLWRQIERLGKPRVAVPQQR